MFFLILAKGSLNTQHTSTLRQRPHCSDITVMLQNTKTSELCVCVCVNILQVCDSFLQNLLSHNISLSLFPAVRFLLHKTLIRTFTNYSTSVDATVELTEIN